MELWNVDHQPVVIDHDHPAVQPGESHDFTDEQLAGGLAGLWSETDPRAGLDAEVVWKARRDAAIFVPADAAAAADSPGEPQEPPVSDPVDERGIQWPEQAGQAWQTETGFDPDEPDNKE